MKSLLLVLVAVLFSVASNGQSSSIGSGSSSTSVKEVLGQKQFEENDKITDTKLRADAGSRSKYSVKFNLSYFGPAAGDLGNPDQPNPDKNPNVNATALSGGISGRYRIDKNATVSVGTGIKARRILHQSLEDTSKDMDTNNPSIGYDYTDKIGGLQTRAAVGGAYTTSTDFRNLGQTGSLRADYNIVSSFEGTRFSFGVDSGVDYYIYNRGVDNRARTNEGNGTRWQISFYPNMKYNFTEKLNLVTSTALSFRNLRGQGDQMKLRRATVNQRVGLGWSLTKDVYINPYIQFYPDNFDSGTMTMNLQTVFSIL